MGRSEILMHGGSEAVREGGRVRLWAGRVIRLAGGLSMVREEVGRRWKVVAKRRLRVDAWWLLWIGLLDKQVLSTYHLKTVAMYVGPGREIGPPRARIYDQARRIVTSAPGLYARTVWYSTCCIYA